MELTANDRKRVPSEETSFVEDIKQIVSTAKTQAYRAVNMMQVASTWLLGWRIVEQMQQGKERADYGTYVIKLASEVLTSEFGEGYSIPTLKFYRQFYLCFKDVSCFAPQMSAHPRFKFHKRKRFNNIIITANGKSFYLIGIFNSCC